MINQQREVRKFACKIKHSKIKIFLKLENNQLINHPKKNQLKSLISQLKKILN